MPARSKITMLPPEIKTKLDRLLIELGFSGYDGITADINAALAADGYEIVLTRSGVHRYGQEFQSRCEDIKTSTEMAKSLVGIAGDDEGNLNEATIRMIQTMTFDLLLKAKKDEDGAYDIADILPKIGVMVAKLSKASVDVKKYAADVRKKTVEAAAETVEKTAKKAGVSPETIELIRRDVLMMAS